MKEAELAKKEQELLTREKQILLKEQHLLKLDSSIYTADTVAYDPNLPGTWMVNMVCTQTNCPGSAIGDTKNEYWEISYQNKNVIAKAMVNNELVRIYSGNLRGNTLELTANQVGTDPQSTARMRVQLQLVDAKRLEGQREIVREGGCKIIYSVQLSK